MLGARDPRDDEPEYEPPDDWDPDGYEADHAADVAENRWFAQLP